MDREALITSFLEQLGELTKQTGIEIRGCGECGSPWLAFPHGLSAAYLRWHATGPYAQTYTLGLERFEDYEGEDAEP